MAGCGGLLFVVLVLAVRLRAGDPGGAQMPGDVDGDNVGQEQQAGAQP